MNVPRGTSYSYIAAYYSALAADNAWQAELERVYGSRAGDARYDQRGTATPELARLHTEFRAAEE